MVLSSNFDTPLLNSDEIEGRTIHDQIKTLDPLEIDFHLNLLKEFVTENRQVKIDQVLQERTKKITVILEDIYQPHNISACLRSCESIGIQEMHILEKRNAAFLKRDIAVGSNNWLDLFLYQEQRIDHCFQKLKNENYQIIATSFAPDAIALEEIDLSKKSALVFGNEELGISPHVLEKADSTMKIPMVGFTQSFNISVSVAISCFVLKQKLKSTMPDWQLLDEEKKQLQLQWYIKSIAKGTEVFNYSKSQYSQKQI